ncbi:amino acid permease [Klebsiella pneumoniae]|nr:amino acid permease [Klebsiella pneumoniae]TWY77369.1 amino acid permease [Klebsiella pneumoniae]
MKDASTSSETVTESGPTLHRGLQNRHIQLIALGGAIGTGLFLGIGPAIQMAGPAVLLGYAVAGIVAFLIMRQLGEMVVEEPVSGSFAHFAYKYWGPFAGFLSGWNYWVMFVLVGMAELTAAGIYMQYWLPDVPTWVWAAAFFIIINAVNLVNVRLYGEAEFWFALIKVLAIIGMIAFGLWMLFGGHGGSNMILVMVSNIANPFCAEVVKGIEEEAEKNGYRILLCNSGSDLARSTSGLQLLSGKMVDGIITMNALSSLPELTTMIGDAPWVQCAEYADTGSISCVGINDVEAAQGAVSRLADSGRRRIALINHDLSYRYARLRERGYKSVLHVHGLAYQQVTYAQDLSAAAGKRAMEQLLSQDEKPDAVFAVSDSLAAGALRAIAQAGLRVPEDIAVIGFDGTELAEVVSPQLTTVEQPSRAIGRTAVSLLMKRIDDPDAAVERVMMDWRVIDRASV